MPVDQTLPGFRFAMRSDVGRVRGGNEDFCAALPERGVFVVCDGMGGAAAGEVASQLAATSFLDHLSAALPLPGITEPLLDAAAQAANTAVYEHAEQADTLRGMGTTLVALLLTLKTEQQDRRLWLTHVGDSRCYRLRRGVLTRLTRDHSLVEDQILAGQLTPEQAERSPLRNIITRAIGSGPHVRPEIHAFDPRPGDLYLLASDGLTRELSDRSLVEHLRAPHADLETMCQSLINAANAAGGNDNITILLLRIL